LAAAAISDGAGGTLRQPPDKDAVSPDLLRCLRVAMMSRATCGRLIFWPVFQFDLHASRFPAIQAGAHDCLVMTNSNFIEIPSPEGQSCELINTDDIASFDYSPATAREAEIPVESAIRIRLKNGKSVVCRGLEAEALRAKLTDGC
jgi:hypothetical protein